MITDFFIRQWLAFSKWKKIFMEKTITFIAVYLDMLFMGRLRPLLVIGPLLVFAAVFLVATWPKWVPSYLSESPIFTSASAPAPVEKAAGAASPAVQASSIFADSAGVFKDFDPMATSFTGDPFHIAASLDTMAAGFPIILKAQPTTPPAWKKKTAIKKRVVKKPFKNKKRYFKSVITAQVEKPKVVTPAPPESPVAAAESIGLIWASYCEATKDQNKCLPN